ncbi:hypothetical protein WA1_18980 [Scytonema hofmannii PCC 7110]|uniref:Uncharacterized protein n=1 Tax=Scytonema hofmannii PCC 7110 TaxID=128403 RepID=A0A139XBK8_9CYAN|nr:hypothetical protein [Scytonema hofmannii]KYC42087.1 hypothetical protein WA1_18980 [Scytonema hofmannii PCC 7110]
MDKEQIRYLAHEAAELSKQGIKLIKAGKYKEGHSYMRRAYLASKECQSLINEGKVQKTLEQFEELHAG